MLNSLFLPSINSRIYEEVDYSTFLTQVEAGQVSEETAFSKKWHNIKVNLTDKELTDWDIADTEKYNKLFSEDLY